MYKNQGKYILSIEAFEQARIRALSSNRFSSRSGSRALFLESVISLGEIYRLQGKYEQAAEEFSKALQMDPDALAAQNNLQYVYKRMHRYDETLSPSSSSLLVNGIFTRISGMTRPKGTYAIDLQFKQWEQQTLRTLEMLEGETLTIVTPLRSSDLFQEDIKGLIAPSATDSTIRAIIFSARYGVTNNFSIGLIPKYFSRKIAVESDGINNIILPTLQDIGDTELLFKYRLWGKTNKHFSIYTLFNLPTGQEKELISKNPVITRTVPQEDGSLIEENWYYQRYVPFGSESWDITPGIAMTIGLDPFTLQSNVQYRFTDGNEVGDEFRFNFATIYRMNPSVNATMEINYRWQGDVRRRMHVILFKRQPAFIGPDQLPAGPVAVETHYTVEGGQLLYLAPGLQFTVAQGVKLEFGMQIPVTGQSDNWTEDTIYQVAVSFMSF